MEARTHRRSPAAVVGLALLAVAVMALPLLAAGRITARFGDSDEGINGAVWGANSRALRELGVVDSRFGGRRADGSLYASHPPGIVAETAAAETVFGEREWASRMPAWLGSMAAMVLLFVLLRRLAGPLVAGASTAAVALSPMFLVYGVMLDTPVTSLVFGLGVLLAWHAAWEGRTSRLTRPPVLAGAAFLAALAGWQATVLVALCGASLLVRHLRDRERPWPPGLWLLAGGATGAALSLSWAWWTYGSFEVMRDKFQGRSAGTEAASIADMVTFQVPWILQLLAFAVIGLVGCGVALRSPRYRPLAAMSLGIVALYALVFHAASAGHQYWNYWAVLPAAVGFAYVFDRLARDAGTNAPLVLVGAVVAIGLGNWLVAPHRAADEIARGHRTVDALLATELPADAQVVPYVGQALRPDSWIRYYTGRAAEPVQSIEQLDQLAATRPDMPVLVLGWCAEDDPGRPFCEAVADALGRAEPVVLPANALVQRLDGSSGPAG
ncbi:ArnT family glycosyltransferase [Rhabdothermincola sp.]|uniref:ArnT family glycosyltransferase n=1 Tax=Rhabdothermincola sp. TaxID=2820405 RepID=UPI002FDF98D6